MTKKENFITWVEACKQMWEKSEKKIDNVDFNYAEALEYFDALQRSQEKKVVEITDTGIKILDTMQQMFDEHLNLFKARDIATEMNTSSRAVTGALRKLVTDGYVEKVSIDSPITYSLTEKGLNFKKSED